MSDTVKAWIEERRTIHAESTDGPWVAEYSGETGDCVIPNDAQSTREAVAVTRLFHRTADANAIADAHNMFPRALDALNAVLELHAELTVYALNDDGRIPLEESEREVMARLCRECSTDECVEAVGDCSWDDTTDLGEVPWPCPTVQAIEGAINHE